MDEWLRMLLGEDDPEKKKGYDILGKFPTGERGALPDIEVTAKRPKLTLADQVRRAQMVDAEAGRNPTARVNRDAALQELVDRSKVAEGAFKDAVASPLLFGLGGAATAGHLTQSVGKLTGIDPLEEMGRKLREGASESKEIVGSTGLANVPYVGGAVAANMVPYVGAAKIAPWAAKGAGAALAGRAVASAPVDAVQAAEEEGNLAGLLGEGARAIGLDKAGDVLDKAGESYLGRFATEVMANVLPDAALEFALPAVKRGATALADENTRIIADRTGAINLGGADDAVPPRLPEGETRGQGVQYHGSTTREFNPTEAHYAAKNFYGQGLYTSDATDVVSRYADRRVKRGGQPGEIFKITPKREMNILDMDAPPPDWVVNAIRNGEIPNSDLAGIALGENPASLRELFDEIRLWSPGEGVSADEVQETFEAISGMAQGRGFDGFRHTGRHNTGGKPDNVTIYFRPEDVSVERVGRDLSARPVAVESEPGSFREVYERWVAGGRRGNTPSIEDYPQFASGVSGGGGGGVPPRDPPSAPGSSGDDFTPEPVAGPITETVMRPDVNEYANIPKFGIDDLDGEVRLRQTMSRVIEDKGLDPKQVVSWDETRKQAEEIGLSVLDIDRSKAAKMSGAEMLAIRNVVGANVEQMQSLAKQLDDPALLGSEREMVQRTFSALDAQNMSLLDKFTTARSQAGRDLNSLKILGNRTGDPAFWWVKARQLLGEGRADQLGDAFKSDVLRLAGEGKMDELYKLIDTNRRTPLKDTFSSVYKAGLLYNPKTHAVNTTGNFLMGALENAKDAPAALGDWVMSLATKTRTTSGPTAMQLRESVKGAKQGVAEAKQILKGVPLQDAMQRFDMPMELRSGSVIVDAYANTPFKLLSAGDRVFRGAAFRASLANQAQTLAKAEGLKGDDLARRAQELIGKPSDEMALRAIADAEEAVFQDRTAIGNILSSVQRFEPLGVPVGTVVMPFSRTPGSIATRAAEYSPLGLAGGIGRAGYVIQRALRGKEVKPEVQRNVARLLGRGATGSSVVAAGYYLMSEGLLTPQGDKKDRTARDTRGLTGTPEGGLVLGDTFVDIGRFAPASNLLLMGAALYDAAQNAGASSPLELAGTMGGSVLRTVSDQPFFQGVENVQRAADDPGNAGANYLKGVASSAVPFTSVLGAAARGTDDVIREPETLGETIKARIPGLSKTVPAALDQFGREAKRRDPGVVNQMLSPASVIPDRAEDDPILKVIRETEAGISRRRPQRGQTKADVRDQVKFEGPRIEKALQSLIRSARFTRADTEAQREMIESAVQNTRRESTTLYKRRVSRALAN